MTTTERALLTVKEVATERCIEHTKTYELIASGQLSAVCVGRSIRVAPEALRDFIDTHPY